MGAIWNLRRAKAAFTLLEVAISIAIFGIVIAASLACTVHIISLCDAAQDRTVAVNHTRRLLEEVRETADGGLNTVTATNWAQWAVNNGLTTLTNEVFAVNYTNVNADPLEMTVLVNWTTRGFPYNHQVITRMTDRT